MSGFISALQEQFPAQTILLPGDDRFSAYLREWRGKFTASALAVLRPASTAETAAMVRLCASHGAAIVPQGGNTGLVGGSVPFKNEQAVIISLDRMSAIRELDAANNTITVDAGCILADIQQAADQADRFFPLSLGAEGSCRIGGNISTNAGGVLTLRYGNTREQVLGLEVVLADGQVWDGLNSLRKNNTGYDLKQLFIGAEGTLGIITGACLKLQPKPAGRVTAMLGFTSPADAITCLNRLQAETGSQLQAFEIMARPCLELAFKHFDNCRDPFAEPQPWYGLAETTSGRGAEELTEQAEQGLADLIEAGIVTDAVLAQNEGQRGDFWHLREAIVEAQRLEGGSIKHDIAVPVSRIAAFIEEGTKLVHELMPGIRPTVFGHIGDGNLHFNMMQPEAMAKDAYLARWDEITAPVHKLVMRYGGSFSAEHGVGRLKTGDMALYKSPVELKMMRAVKAALDPENRMNPGKVLPEG
jgi:FAD/FMN-containing dehydrogenase